MADPATQSARADAERSGTVVGGDVDRIEAAIHADLARDASAPATKLAHLIRNEIIGGHAPYWALDGNLPGTTADEVRAEVGPVLTEIIHACSDVIGDGFYPA